MTLSEQRVLPLFTVVISVIGGFSVYYVLHYLLMPQPMAIPLAVIVSLLIFALTRFYSESTEYTKAASKDDISDAYANQKEDQVNDLARHRKNKNGKIASSEPSIRLSCFLFFITVYSTMLAITAFSPPDLGVFTSWSNIDPAGIIQLAAAIILVFFVPGYAIMLMLTEKCKIDNILKVVLAYLTSILVTGLSVYISATSFDVSAVDIKNILTCLYLAILASYIIFYSLRYKARTKIKIKSSFTARSSTHVNKQGQILWSPFRRSGTIKKCMIAKNSGFVEN